MPQRAMSLVLGLVGLAAVVAVMAAGQDPGRAAEKSPRWLRRAIIAAMGLLAFLGPAGLFYKELAKEDKAPHDGVDPRHPGVVVCYVPLSATPPPQSITPITIDELLGRLSQRLSVLKTHYDSGKGLNRKTLVTTLDAIDQDLVDFRRVVAEDTLSKDDQATLDRLTREVTDLRARLEEKP